MTPIGPFCPFSSGACSTESLFGQGVSELVTSRMPRLLGDLAKLQSSVRTGDLAELMRNREQMAALADDLAQAEEEWRVLLARMRMATDFQSREYHKIAVSWTRWQGESLDTMGSMMRYSAETMRSVAAGVPPAPPPRGYDPAKLMSLWVRQGSAAGLSVVATRAAGGSSGDLPFTGREGPFSSEVVAEEYRKLCDDHRGLISFGERFGDFDPLGQVAFLDALEAVEERWDVFFSRFRLLDQLNPVFEAQARAFLDALGMDAGEFRELLHNAHGLLRADAEADRARGPALG